MNLVSTALSLACLLAHLPHTKATFGRGSTFNSALYLANVMLDRCSQTLLIHSASRNHYRLPLTGSSDLLEKPMTSPMIPVREREEAGDILARVPRSPERASFFAKTVRSGGNGATNMPLIRIESRSSRKWDSELKRKRHEDENVGVGNT